MKNRLLCILSIIIFIVSLTGCDDQKKIDNTISLIEDLKAVKPSTDENYEEKIHEINSAYDDLTDTEKEKVTNYSDFLDCFGQYKALYVVESINELGQVEYSDSFLEKLDSVESDYKSLDDKSKEYVTNYSTYTDARNKYSALELVNTLSNYDETSYSSLEEKIQECKDYLSDEELFECLNKLGACKSLSWVEEDLISRLKDPSSYQRVSYFTYCSPSRDIRGFYTTKVSITYSATNSFGGRIQDTIDLYAFYRSDVKHATVDLIKVSDSTW